MPRTVIFDLKNNIGQVKRSLNYPETKSQSDKVAEAKEVWFVNFIKIYILYCVGVKIILKYLINKGVARILMKIKNLKLLFIHFRRDYTIINTRNNL